MQTYDILHRHAVTPDFLLHSLQINDGSCIDEIWKEITSNSAYIFYLAMQALFGQPLPIILLASLNHSISSFFHFPLSCRINYYNYCLCQVQNIANDDLVVIAMFAPPPSVV